jgi:hypothetical protein
MLTASDLITKTEQTVDGFVWQANQKIELSNSYISLAIKAKQRQLAFTNIDAVFNDKELYDFVVGACCLSRKSLTHISKDAQKKIFENLIDFTNIYNDEYFAILTHRFLLTSGDSMGGSMRNLIGQSAQILFTEKFIQFLNANSVIHKCSYSSSGKITAVSWNDRLLIFDKKPKFINKSIDFILLSGTCSIEKPGDFIACGELKGGIDPAGADEHWKTARSALERIHLAFNDRNLQSPQVYFVGAAIEKAMATEIQQLLKTGWLSGAANLNSESQLDMVIRKICS